MTWIDGKLSCPFCRYESQRAHLLRGKYGDGTLGRQGRVVDLSGIFLAFYRPTNRFHVSTDRVRLVTVMP